MSHVHAYAPACLGHRRSGVPVYGIIGAAGNAEDVWRVLGQVWPGKMFSFNPRFIMRQAGFYSIKQVAALNIVLSVLAGGPLKNSVLIGWSLGAAFAFASEVELEASGEGVRAAVELDNSGRAPLSAASRASFDQAERRFWCGASRQWALPLLFRSAFILEFTCPFHHQVTIQSIRELNARRALCTAVGDVVFCPDSDHMTVGVDYAWDIARRVRALVVQ